MTHIKPQNILIVDDEPQITKILGQAIENLGEKYLVDTANSGYEAIVKVQQIKFELILVDYKMPGMNGLQFIEEVHKHYPAVRFLLISGHPSIAKQQPSLTQYNVVGFIKKPFNIDQLKTSLFQALEGPAPAADRQASDNQISIADPLKYFQINSSAKCALVLSKSGHIIESAGATNDLDINSMSALAAANYMASVELAKLLGNQTMFKSSYHEGPNYNIYSFGIDEDYLLVVIFGHQSTQGVIRHYTNQLVHDIAPLLANRTLPSMASLDNEFFVAFEEDLNDLFKN